MLEISDERAWAEHLKIPTQSELALTPHRKMDESREGQTSALWMEVSCAGDSIKSRKEGHKERRDVSAGRKQ